MTLPKNPEDSGCVVGKTGTFGDYGASALVAVIDACVAARVPLLLGTTGLPASLEPELTAAARRCASAARRG